MLRQEMNGFSLGQRPAWGSCIMEIKNNKGKFTLNIQGLKKLNDNRDYTLYVIGGKAGKADGISCGRIEVDNFGKGELRWEFDPDNICGTGLSVEELHTIAIVVGGQQQYGLTAPIAGYFAEKVNWKTKFHELAKRTTSGSVSKQAVKPTIAESQVASQPKESIENIQVPETKLTKEKEINFQNSTLIAAESATLEEPVEVNEVHTNETAALKMVGNTLSEKEGKNNFQENFKNMLLQFQKELSNLEKHGVLTPEDIKKINPSSQETIKTEKVESVERIKEKAEIKQEPLSDIEYIFQKNDAIIPFVSDDFTWRCICMEELSVLPVSTLTLMHHIFSIHSYRKYKHFVLGRNEAGKMYLGLPNHYNPEDKKIASQLGFQKFRPCGSEKVERNCHGYWITEIKN